MRAETIALNDYLYAAEERADDMVRDGIYLERYLAYRADREATLQQRYAEDRQRNPELAARMDAIRARLNTGKQLTAQARTSRLMWQQTPRILNDTQPTPF